jgi:hypothetical protein
MPKATKLTVLYGPKPDDDYFKPNSKKKAKGVALEKFLEQNKARLQKMRLLYVIKSNLDRDKDIYKIGIGGVNSGHGIGRLYDYVHMMGPNNPQNSCQGAQLYYLGGTKYDASKPMWHVKSRVYQIEKFVKDEMKQEGRVVEGRGLERFNTPLKELLCLINAKQETTEETQERVRASQRLLRKDDKVLEVLETRNTGGKNKKLTQYKLKWSRADESTGDATTWETLRNIRANKIPGGVDAVKKYQDKHKKAYRD